MDLGHKEEVEKLARTLKQNKVAHSESQAYAMAEEMLSTSKKVHADFKERDAKIYGREKNPEVEMAHKMMEKITQNMSQGKSDVRINLGELDLQRPLKELVPAEEVPTEAEEEDDAVLMNEPAVQQAVEAPVQKKASDNPEVINVDDDDFFDDDDDDKDDTEEEKSNTSIVFSSEGKEEEDGEFSVKEL